MTLTDNNCSDSDYGVMIKFKKSEVEKMFEKMKGFIAAIETLIQE